MNEHGKPAATENPFSTSRIRGGAIPFLFPGDETARQLIDRLDRDAWWGQIIGPHGSGKSALLATLAPLIERAGRRVRMICLHDGQRRLPFDSKHTADVDRSTVLIVDGYEQLGRFARFRLKRFCRRGGLGLLVTSHVPAGLPELFQTSASLELAQQIVEWLQREDPSHVTAEDVGECFARHAGDVREMLFELYDLYERRRREG